MIKECNFEDEIEITVQNKKIILSPVVHSIKKIPRKRWGNSFKLMAEREDDKQLNPDISNQWDQDNWKW